MSINTRKAQWVEDEAKRLNTSRSQIVERLIDAGMQYLAKRDSIGYTEIDFLEANEDEMTRLMRRCATVIRERKKMADTLATSSSNTTNTCKVAKDNLLSLDVTGKVN